MTKQNSYQDLLLNQLRKDNIPATIFLTNGFQLRGNVVCFDTYVIILDSDGKQQMVYKHAVSTIVPAKAIRLNAAES